LPKSNGINDKINPATPEINPIIKVITNNIPIFPFNLTFC